MFDEATQKQAEGKHANAPTWAEWDAWAIKTRNELVEAYNREITTLDEWTDAMTKSLQQSDKKLTVLKEKEAKLDAAILKAETLERCYLKVFKSALDKTSVQPQGTPAPTPASKEDAPIERNLVTSLLPAPVVMQASKGYVPKAEEVLNHPNAAQLGKKSIRLLQELTKIMGRKALFVFTHDNVQDWLDISRGTSYGHIAFWQKVGFIEKKGSLYTFVPPPSATTAPTPQEGSQPAV